MDALFFGFLATLGYLLASVLGPVIMVSFVFALFFTCAWLWLMARWAFRKIKGMFYGTP